MQNYSSRKPHRIGVITQFLWKMNMGNITHRMKFRESDAKRFPLKYVIQYSIPEGESGRLYP